MADRLADIDGAGAGVGAAEFADSAAPAGASRTAPPHQPEIPIVDVWSRTAPRYRRRAWALLILNFLIFCGLCAFTFWLHVGYLFEFSLESYLRPFRFWGPQTQNLNDFIVYPINVEQVPIHGVVLGLLVASKVGVPILIAILYRFPFSLPFIGAVLLLAHSPWLAITLLGSCILASCRPFRLSFRFSSALIAMLPVLAYLYLSTRDSTDALGGGSPTQRALLVAPWVIAILGACVMMGLVLLISRLVNYRPGAVAPVIGLMFATPAVLFFLYVGTDELDYRVLEAEYGPRSPRFASAGDATVRIRELMNEYEPGPDDVRDVWSGEVTRLKNRVSRRMLAEFLKDREAAYAACNRFITYHPTSRYVSNVLYIQGRAMDTRLDERRLREAARRELYADFPHAQSESAWTALLTQFPRSPLVPAGRLALAQLRLREGRIDAALEVLAPLTRPPPADRPTATQPSEPAFFSQASPESSLEFDPVPFLFEGLRLHERIVANRQDERFGPEPLTLWARLDARRGLYGAQLATLATRFAGSALEDNLHVDWAGSLPAPAERAAQLEACLARFPEGDAAPEAMFRLADLEIQTLAEENHPNRARGIARLRQLVERFGDTCWGREATARLEMLEPAVRAARADRRTGP